MEILQAGLETAKQEADSRATALETDLAAAKRETEVATGRVEELQAEVETLRESLVKAEASLEEVSSLRNLASGSQDQVTQMEERIGALAMEAAENRDALEKARREAEREIATLRDELNTAQTDRDGLEKEIRRLGESQADSVAAREELEEARTNASRFEKKLTESASRTLKLEEEIKRAQATIDELEKERDENRSRLEQESARQMDMASGVSNEMETLRSRVVVLSESNEKLEKRLHEAFEIMQQPDRTAPSTPPKPTPGDPDLPPEPEEPLPSPADGTVQDGSQLKEEIKSLSHVMQLCLIELEQGGRLLESSQVQLKECREKSDSLFEAWSLLEKRMEELPPHLMKEAHFRYINEALDEIRLPIRSTKTAFDSAQRISDAQQGLIGKLYKTLTSKEQ